MMRVLLLFSFFVLASCGQYPKDTRGTLNEIQNQKVIHIGLIEQKPWSYRHNGNLRGVEVEILSKFADSLNVQPQWTVLSESQAIEKLEHYEFDIVAGGLVQSNPRKKSVGFTRPYLITGDDKKSRHVMAVPVGENRLLITLEKFLKRNKSLINQYYQKEVGRQ